MNAPSPAAPPGAARSFRRILIATDFGEGADRALQVGLALARLGDASVVLAHVHYIDTFNYAVGLTYPFAQLREAAELRLEQAVNDARALYARTEPLFLEGFPAEGILEAIRRSRADVAVMATHGRSGLLRFVMGSVTDKVLRSATVPVLAVPPADEEPAGD